jgi:hypothetical protein
MLWLAALASGCATPDEPGVRLRDEVAQPKRMAPPPAAGQPGTLSGRVRLEERFGPAASVPFEKVGLYRNGRLVSESSTDSAGRFLFVDIKDPGDYEVALLSDRFGGSARVHVALFPRGEVEIPAHKILPVQGP